MARTATLSLGLDRKPWPRGPSKSFSPPPWRNGWATGRARTYREEVTEGRSLSAIEAIYTRCLGEEGECGPPRPPKGNGLMTKVLLLGLDCADPRLGL